MTFEKSSETSTTVVFQSDRSQKEINEKFQTLISNSNKDPFYVFKNPSYLFKVMDYAGAIIRSENIYIPRSITTAPVFIEFEIKPNGKTEVTFRVSYLPVFRFAFFIAIPLASIFIIQGIIHEPKTSVILIGIGLILMIAAFIALLAYIHEKMNNYFFKRDVKRILKDLGPI